MLIFKGPLTNSGSHIRRLLLHSAHSSVRRTFSATMKFIGKCRRETAVEDDKNTEHPHYSAQTLAPI